MGSLGAPELLIILVIILLVFGGAKLPKLAKSLGQAQREFKKGTVEAEREELAAERSAESSSSKAQPSKDSPAT
ncbi:MAG: twin-arginine translocase TatA/TatE family subunit [Actinobacteria bacterium]|nr:twin-arginine translocase TatA/TatE family subunit [Actinomycetota bacterium]